MAVAPPWICGARGTKALLHSKGYTWQQPGQKLRVTFSEDTWVDLSWNAKDGSGVTAHAEKPKEEP